jgi:hypothetical protein
LNQGLSTVANLVRAQDWASAQAAFDKIEWPAGYEATKNSYQMQIWMNSDKPKFLNLVKEQPLGSALRATAASLAVSKAGSDPDLCKDLLAILNVPGETYVPTLHYAGAVYAGLGDYKSALAMAKRASAELDANPDKYATLNPAFLKVVRDAVATYQAKIGD